MIITLFAHEIHQTTLTDDANHSLACDLTPSSLTDISCLLPIHQTVVRLSRIASMILQVTLVYQAEMLHRPDIALMYHGWVPRSRPPLLLAHDYGGRAAEDMRQTASGGIITPRNDNAYGVVPIVFNII